MDGGNDVSTVCTTKLETASLEQHAELIMIEDYKVESRVYMGARVYICIYLFTF